MRNRSNCAVTVTGGPFWTVIRIGPIMPLLFLMDHFGPIHDTIKSTVAAKGIERVKNALSILYA